jgi:hypothetical protein
MRWATITDSQDEQAWFEEYVRIALTTPAPSLPPTSQRVGACEVTWFETEPGVAFVAPEGGSFDDRTLATLVVSQQLAGHGIRPATFSFDNRHADEEFQRFAQFRHSTWEDVEAKAKRLIQSGSVQVNRKSYNEIAGTVQGDHDTYNTEIRMQDPDSQSITWWQCDCPWNQFAWQRTRQWKKYEGRCCSHTLALYWAAKQVPVDEDVHPSGQQSLFGMPYTPTGRPSPGSGAPGPAPQGQQLPMPGMFPGTAEGTPGQESGPPPPPSAIPPNPYDPANMQPQANPASVPGLKQPSPTNPVQYPGGTFSSVQDWDLNAGWDFAKVSAMDSSSDFYNPPPLDGHLSAAEVAALTPSEGRTWEDVRQDFEANHPTVMAALRDDIAKRGVLTPLVVDRDRGLVLAGHHRVLAGQDVGLDRYPVHYNTQVDPERYDWDPASRSHVPYEGDFFHEAAGPTGFQNGAIVQTKEEDWGVWVGKSEAHGAGSPTKIPMNSQGEVLGQDPTTGMVNVLFMGKIADKNGPLEPYGATAWYFPSQLVQRPDVKPPGPAIRRR